MLSVFPSISGCHKISFFSVLSVFLSSFSAGTKNDISLRQFLKYMEDVYFTLLCNSYISLPFHSQHFIPYCLPQNSNGVSLKNLILD